MVRQQRGEKLLRPVEKMHVLYGFFGRAGGEQIILITRFEWPIRQSLYEIRQAVLWAEEQGRERAGERIAGGIKPRAGEKQKSRKAGCWALTLPGRRDGYGSPYAGNRALFALTGGLQGVFGCRERPCCHRRRAGYAGGGGGADSSPRT
jgi:hypothetical protein